MMGFPTVPFSTVDTRHIEFVHVRFAVVNISLLDDKFLDPQEMFNLLDSSLFKNLRVASFNVQYDLNVICSRIESALKTLGIDCEIAAAKMLGEIPKSNVHVIEHRHKFDTVLDRSVSLTSVASSDWSSGQQYIGEVCADVIETTTVIGAA